MARTKKMAPVLDPLDAMLTRLQLTGIRDQLDNLLDEASRATCLRARRWRSCANGRLPRKTTAASTWR